MSRASIAVGFESTFLNSELEEKLREAGCDPFEILANLAISAEEEGTRLGAAKELAKYLRPQLKSIDVRMGNGNQVRKFAIVKFSDVDPAHAAELAKGMTPRQLTEKLVPNAALIDTMRRDFERPVAVEDPMLTVTKAEAMEEEKDEASVHEEPRGEYVPPYKRVPGR